MSQLTDVAGLGDARAVGGGRCTPSMLSRRRGTQTSAQLGMSAWQPRLAGKPCVLCSVAGFRFRI